MDKLKNPYVLLHYEECSLIQMTRMEVRGQEVDPSFAWWHRHRYCVPTAKATMDREPKKQTEALGWWCWGVKFTRFWCHVIKSEWLTEQVSPCTVVSPLLTVCGCGSWHGCIHKRLNICLWGLASNFFQWGHPISLQEICMRFGSSNCQWYLHFSVKKPTFLPLALNSMRGKSCFRS